MSEPPNEKSPEDEAELWRAFLSWARAEFPEGEGEGGLTREMYAYFGKLTDHYFTRHQENEFPDATPAQRPRDGKGSWEAFHICLEYFQGDRVRAKVPILMDMVPRALERARKKLMREPTEAEFVRFLKSQWQMRTRDAVRRHYGSLSRLTISGASAGNGDGDEEGSWDPVDLVALVRARLSPEEVADIQRIANDCGTNVFQALTNEARLCVFLSHHKISLADPEITARLGKGKSVLFDLASSSRARAEECVSSKLEADGIEKDIVGFGEVAGDEALYAECRRWFFPEEWCAPFFPLVKAKQPFLFDQN